MIAIVAIFFHLPTKWIHDSDASICIHKRVFGIGCPFCGMTRAMFEMIHLNFKDAIKENFAIIPFGFLLVSAIFYIIYPLKMRKIFFILLYFTLAVFSIVYILRLAGLY